MKVDGLIRRVAKLEKNINSEKQMQIRFCWKEDHQTEEEAMLSAGISDSDRIYMSVVFCKWSSGDKQQ